MHNSAPLRQRDFSLFTFHSSLFTKRRSPNGASHSSFFIHHSSFKKSPCVRRVTGGYNKAITIKEKKYKKQ